MNSERSRLRTFRNWPSNAPVNSKRIAKAGFYYMGHNLEVQCFACGGRISDWNYNDCVISKHRTLDPRCPFVIKPEASGNISIENEEHYKLEAGRLTSFNNWPVTFIVTPEALAKTGFYYLKLGDKVKCAFCSIIIGRWEVGDSAEGEHIRQSPNCPFLAQKSKNNGGNNPTQSNFINMRAVNEDMSDLGVYNHRAPKHSDLSTFDSRLKTFTTWPRNNPLKPQDLASAGFFYVGQDDQVRCFHCDGGLLKWAPKDEPWIEHARWFSECHFVTLVKGERFIEDAIKANPPIANTFLTPQFFMKPCTRRSRVTNEQVQELMTSNEALAALQIGVEASRVKAAIRQRLESYGSSFDSADSLIGAALEIQFDEYVEYADAEDDAWGTPPDSPHVIPYRNGRENGAFVVDTSVPNTPSQEEPVESETERTSSAEDSDFHSPTQEETSEASSEIPEDEHEDVLRTPPEEIEVIEKFVKAQSDDVPTNTGDINDRAKNESLEDEIRRLKEARLCKICMDNEVGVVLLPCGHLVTCLLCASNLPKCPVCRESIKATVRTFIS